MNVTITAGGQAGSEGKGAITAALHRERRYDFAVRIGGPNAGHTVVGRDKSYALRQLPVAAVADERCTLVIAAGSEVDPDVLGAEIEMLEADGYRVRDRLLVDHEVTVIQPRHRVMEKEIQTGTTGKGIGGVRADRALRLAKRAIDVGIRSVDTQELLREAVWDDDRVMIEGTQGYVLGTHAGYYPYCTSGDCRAADFLAATGLAPQPCEVWVVLRTHPIRIAGNSGPMGEETSWVQVGVDPEYTTVTKKMRRVGEWDWDWAIRSVRANTAPGNPPRIALTFADYWWPWLRHRTELHSDEWQRVAAAIGEIEGALRAPVEMLGTGPASQVWVEREMADAA